MTPNFVVTETSRLRIQVWQLNDIPSLVKLTQQPGLSEFSIGGYANYSTDRATAWIKHELGRFAKHRLGKFAVISKKLDEPIGICGLFHIPPDENEVELNYRFPTEYRGQGYATEAAAAVLEYGFDVLGLPQINANVDLRNEGSVRVLQRLGLQRVGEVTYAGIKASRWKISRR